MYESKITNVRWIIYDIAGNIGWILCFVCLYLYHSIMSLPVLILEGIPAMLMLTGILELINERINRLDRILPKKRLLLGFGTLTTGGAIGMLNSLICFIICKEEYCIFMLIGSFLCGLFAWLLFKGYKKVNTEAG